MESIDKNAPIVESAETQETRLAARKEILAVKEHAPDGDIAVT